MLPLTFILIFAIAGVAYMVLTHAQTTVPDTTIGAPAGDCIQAGTSGQATVAKCNGATNQQWQMTAQTINNSALGGGKYCLTATGTAARTAVVSKPCGGANQAWVRPTFAAGAGTMEDVAAYNTGGTAKGPRMCLVNPTTVANPQALPLVITGCDTTATNYADQNFQISVYPPATSKPTPPAPPAPVSSGPCTGSPTKVTGGTAEGNAVATCAYQELHNWATQNHTTLISKYCEGGNNACSHGEWCAGFTSYVYREAGHGFGQINLAYNMGFHAKLPGFTFHAAGSGYKPKIGDIQTSLGSGAGHVQIVVKTSPLTFISGNSGNAVIQAGGATGTVYGYTTPN